MKKMMAIILLLSIAGLVSVSAESWIEFMERVEIIFLNVRSATRTGQPEDWSYDKWGAMLASYEYLEKAYQDLYMNAPLSEEQRNNYRNWYQGRVEAHKLFTGILERYYGGNVYIYNTIIERYQYWYKHLVNGGTINFS